MIRIVFRPEAEEEILEARGWYDARSPGLGGEFARSADDAVSSAAEMPLAHPRLEGEYRHVILRRFPYSVIYLPCESEIVVISCFHHKRKPISRS
ncbi:type II toxin-antitoxin system RelE/ParE family toxin [Endothiovibrio diazotrophicus]